MKEKMCLMKTKVQIAGLQFLSVFAIVIALVGINTTCFVIGYQDKLPEKVEEFRRY